MKPIDSFNDLLNKFSHQRLSTFGLMIMASSHHQTLDEISTNVLKELIDQHHLIVLRGFQQPNKDELTHYAEHIGPLLAWDFGVVMEMRAHEDAKNYLFTEGHVPFHWDGAFHQEPSYLLFHCIEAPSVNSGGETLFANTNAIWEHSNQDERNQWRHIQLTYETEKLAHYGGKITIPLVQTHPRTQKTILRFAEPVPDHMLNPVTVNIDYLENKNTFLQMMADRCYQQAYCYTHKWENNDILFADNFSLIHARHAFKKISPRHLRRIQIL